MRHLMMRADVKRGIPLADRSVQCCLTSPPYWGLRDYGIKGQLGLEKTPEEYVARMVDVFREVRRVLRDDGVMWLNIGDSYAATSKGSGGTAKSGLMKDGRPELQRQKTAARSVSNQMLSETRTFDLESSNLKAKDLVGIPWMLAFALRADGWYLRSDVIWHKPNPMTESIRDRPTKSHEYVFLLTKSARYFYDAGAIVERSLCPESHRPRSPRNPDKRKGDPLFATKVGDHANGKTYPTRNCRSVWTISTRRFNGAHFATMSPLLAERCIKAGTSEKGCCPGCGKPWKRLVEKSRVATRPGTNSKVNRASSESESPYNGHSGTVVGNRDPHRHTTESRTVGWEAGCGCGLDPVPCRVLDPFSGSFTTSGVCEYLGRDSVGLELNRDYIAMAPARIASLSAWHAERTRPRYSRRARLNPRGQLGLFDLSDESAAE